MELFVALLRQYGANLVAIGVFAATVFHCWHTRQWQLNLRPLIFAFAGLMAFVASDDWSEWTGRYGWTRGEFYVQPEWYIRAVGAIVLVGAAVVIFRT